MPASLRILDETRVDVDGASEILGVTPYTIYRAMKRDDLEYLRTGPRRGGKIITSREAIARYLAKVNGLDASDTAGAGPARSKRRERELAKVDAALDKAGV
jgi:hypothetical protein